MRYLEICMLLVVFGIFYAFIMFDIEYYSDNNHEHLLLTQDSKFYYYDQYHFSDGCWQKVSDSVYLLSTVFHEGRDIRQVASGYYQFQGVKLVVHGSDSEPA